ncbi:MAG TPA: hypothetical protein VHL34_01240 [Rhizomicrobium sp.]|nr:hypothetical protein [Rhizomicrobium sp.]
MTVATFTEAWEAHMLRGRLEAEGVRASLAHELHVANNWPIATALGGVKVQVPAEDAQRAFDIEAACAAGRYRDELRQTFGDLDDVHCPGCGGHDLTRSRSFAQLLLLLISSYFATIFPLSTQLYRCNACDTRWRETR